MPSRRIAAILAAATVTALASACGTAPPDRGVLTVGAIPDQDPQKLARQHRLVAARLSARLGVPVRYRPVVDYTAAVSAFRTGDLDLVWFGGLTGVQARRQVPGARVLAQRDIDRRFRSVFIASARSGLRPLSSQSGLRALAGRRVLFGSASSTSGRLMPQLFLARAGVRLEDLRGEPGFSGSHDRTIDLVAAGSFDAGAVNEQVWRDRVRDGTVDRDRVRVLWRSPAYNDYHWVLRPDTDERFGRGFADRVRSALLGLHAGDADDRRILDLFGAGRFVPAGDRDHEEVVRAGTEAGLLR